MVVFDPRRSENDRRDRNDRNYRPQGYQNRDGFRGRDREKDQDGDRDQEEDRDRDARDYGRDRPHRRDSGVKDASRVTKGPYTSRERPGTSEQLPSPSTLTSPNDDQVLLDRQLSKTVPPPAPRAAIGSMSSTMIPPTTQSTEPWQQMIDLIIQRFTYSTMKERAQKASQKAQQAWEKYRQSPSDVGSSLSFLEKQKRDNEDEKNKFDRLIRENIEKSKSLSHQLHLHAGQITEQNGSSKSLPVNGNTTSTMDRAEMQAKFASMEETMEKRLFETVSKRLGEEAASARRKQKSEWESQALRLQIDMAAKAEIYEQQISELKTKAASEASRNNDLEERLKRLEGGKSRNDELGKRLKRLEERTSRNVELEERLKRLEEEKPRRNELEERLKRLEEEKSRNHELGERVKCLYEERFKHGVLEERVKRLEEEEVRSQTPPVQEFLMKTNSAAIRLNATAIQKNLAGIQHLNQMVDAHQEHIRNANARFQHLEVTASQLMSQVQALADRAKEPSPPATEKLEAEEKQRQEIALLHAEWSKLPVECLQTLPTDFSTIKKEVQGFSAELAHLKTQIYAARQSQSRSPPAPSTSVEPSSDQRIEQILKSQSEDVDKKIKAKIGKLAVDFGGFIDNDRNEMKAFRSKVEESLNAQAQGASQMQTQMEEKLSVLRTAVDEIRSKPTLHQNFMDDQARINYRLINGTTQHSSRLVALDNRSDTLERSTKANFEAIDMQIHNLTHWQQNFDTRPLFRDIAAHMNAIIPDNVSRSLTNLTNRVIAIERQSAQEEGSNKRRRLDMQQIDPGIRSGPRSG